MFSDNAEALGTGRSFCLEAPPPAHAELLVIFPESVGIFDQEAFPDALHPRKIVHMPFLNTWEMSHVEKSCRNESMETFFLSGSRPCTNFKYKPQPN